MSQHAFDEKTVARFWSKVNKDGPVPSHCPELGPCWVWTGGTSRGYGQMKIRGRDYKAHRISAVIAGLACSLSATNKSELVLHRCDNPSCVRIDHLFIGDQKLNIKDAAEKQRLNNRIGECVNTAKLSVQDVIDIRRTYKNKQASSAEIGLRYKLSRSQILQVVSGKSWRHIPGAIKTSLPSGEEHKNSKLTSEKVLQIRNLDGRIPHSAIGLMFGICQTLVSRIVKRRAWKHVP